LKNVGAVGVEILAFPLTWHIAYTTACCYRTSRDNLLAPPLYTSSVALSAGHHINPTSRPATMHAHKTYHAVLYTLRSLLVKDRFLRAKAATAFSAS